MKTSKNVLIKLTQLTVFMLIICMQSCDTEIPPEDLEPPTFRFEITGDGFNQAFDQNTDFDSFQLNLREDAEYDFVFSAGDPGGMKQIQWQYASDYIELETAIPSSWQTTISGLSTFVNWFGDETNPVTGNILTGTFRANGDLVGHSFNFMAKDFGGSSSMENTIFKSLNIFSGNHPTEIRNF